MQSLKKIGKEDAINNLVAAISVGIHKGELVLDLIMKKTPMLNATSIL